MTDFARARGLWRAPDGDEPREVREFRLAAERLTRRVTRSRATALAFLVRLGICTPTGRLTKRYR